jgi:hypothetical protein
LNGFGEVLGLQIFCDIEIGYGARNFEKPNDSSLRVSLEVPDMYGCPLDRWDKQAGLFKRT